MGNKCFNKKGGDNSDVIDLRDGDNQQSNNRTGGIYVLDDKDKNKQKGRVYRKP